MLEAGYMRRRYVVVRLSLSTCAFLTLVVLVLDTTEASIISPGASDVTVTCPRICFCNTPSHIVYCSRRGLPAIPTGIPSTTVQLNLNGNAFQTPNIQRRNFSSLTDLEHLYMSECSIERIVVDAFADLTSLEWLDLSNNHIMIIDDQTFRGVTLQHLFLNGNRNMELVSGSFRGLSTTGLYLHDCSLRHLAPNVLYPLNSTIKYLWLNGNDIVRIDRGLETVFSALQHLRLGENPLRCDCSAIWLKHLYDSNGQMFSGAPVPSCRSPNRLRGRQFNETLVDEFLCRAPQFTRVEVLANDSSGSLSCAAVGEPVPVVYWIQPSGRVTRYVYPHQQSSDIGDDRGQENEGTLLMESDKGLFGMYICIANNDAGNVTLTVSVPASASDLGRPVFVTESSTRFTGSSTTPRSTARVSMLSERRLTSTADDATASPISSSRLDDDQGPSFTLTQLVLSVVLTHIVTLLVYMLLVVIWFWTRCGRDQFTRRRRPTARRVHHRSTVCSGSSGSTLCAKLSSLPQSPCCGSPQREAAVFLNGLCTRRDLYLDTAPTAYRFADGEYG